MVQQTGKQTNFFLRYLSLAPVLAVVTVSIALTLWAFINYFVPDLLLFPWQ